jgi:hypothetical protein
MINKFKILLVIVPLIQKYFLLLCSMMFDDRMLLLIDVCVPMLYTFWNSYCYAMNDRIVSVACCY